MLSELNKLPHSQWYAFMAGRQHAIAQDLLFRARGLIDDGYLIAARTAISLAREAHRGYRRYLLRAQQLQVSL